MPVTGTRIPGHRLVPAGPVSSGRWGCECGAWTGVTPARGPFGRTTMRARIVQLNMAHGKHARAAQIRSQR